MRIAPAITLTGEQRKQLESWARGRSLPRRLGERAQMILLASEGRQNKEIARTLRRGRQGVARWRQRFIERGLAGIEKDAPRPGRKPKLSAARVEEIVRKTTQETPSQATHWSTRSMARAAGVSEATVRRIWRAHGLKPHRVRSFKLSNDPQFAEKLEEIVGLYLNPPDHALVLSLDEKSQVQALDRTRPLLPMRPGIPARQTHDYIRHGTTSLFAALNVATGKVVGRCYRRHRHQELLKFLDQVDATLPPDGDVHVIMDNYGTHKVPKVARWFARHPRFHVHFTPTSASWLNQVERWFATLTQKYIRRGTHRSTRQLEQAIRHYIKINNDDPKPFVWSKTADDILASVERFCLRTSNSRH